MSTENYSFINPTRIIETAMDSSNLSPLPLSAKNIILKQAERSFPADDAVIRVQEGLITIPRFEEGTKGRPFEGGPAIVGEKGPELVTTPGGQKILTPGEATLVNLPPGAQVIPNASTVINEPGKPSAITSADSQAEKTEKTQGFFSRLFGRKAKMEESASQEVKPAESKAPNYRVVGEINPSVDEKGDAIPNEVVVGVKLQKQKGSDWEYLAGARSDGDIETAHREAIAILENTDLKNYPEAANVKMPSPTELVGYDKLEKPSEAKKTDKPVVSRVYGEIYEVTGASPDKNGKIDFSPKYEVGLWGEHFDGRILRDVDTVYGKQSNDPAEAYKSAEDNFLKTVTLAQKQSAKIPDITELDGYSDIQANVRPDKAITQVSTNLASLSNSNGKAFASTPASEAFAVQAATSTPSAQVSQAASSRPASEALVVQAATSTPSSQVNQATASRPASEALAVQAVAKPASEALTQMKSASAGEVTQVGKSPELLSDDEFFKLTDLSARANTSIEAKKEYEDYEKQLAGKVGSRKPGSPSGTVLAQSVTAKPASEALIQAATLPPSSQVSQAAASRPASESLAVQAATQRPASDVLSQAAALKPISKVEGSKPASEALAQAGAKSSEGLLGKPEISEAARAYLQSDMTDEDFASLADFASSATKASAAMLEYEKKAEANKERPLSETVKSSASEALAVQAATSTPSAQVSQAAASKPASEALAVQAATSTPSAQVSQPAAASKPASEALAEAKIPSVNQSDSAIKNSELLSDDEFFKLTDLSARANTSIEAKKEYEDYEKQLSSKLGSSKLGSPSSTVLAQPAASRPASEALAVQAATSTPSSQVNQATASRPASEALAVQAATSTPSAQVSQAAASTPSAQVDGSKPASEALAQAGAKSSEGLLGKPEIGEAASAYLKSDLTEDDFASLADFASSATKASAAMLEYEKKAEANKELPLSETLKVEKKIIESSQQPPLASSAILAESAQPKDETVKLPSQIENNSASSQKAEAGSSNPNEEKNLSGVKSIEPTTSAEVLSQEAKAPKKEETGSFTVEGTVKMLNDGSARVSMALIDSATGRLVVKNSSSGLPLAEAYDQAAGTMAKNLEKVGLTGISVPTLEQISKPGANSERGKSSNAAANLTDATVKSNEAPSLSVLEKEASTEPVNKDEPVGFWSKVKSLFRGKTETSQVNEAKSIALPSENISSSESEEQLAESDNSSIDSGKEINVGNLMKGSLSSESSSEKSTSANEKMNSLTASIAVDQSASPKTEESSQATINKANEMTVKSSAPVQKATLAAVANPQNPLIPEVQNLSTTVKETSNQMSNEITKKLAETASSQSTNSTTSTITNNVSNLTSQPAMQVESATQMQPGQAQMQQTRDSNGLSEYYLQAIYEALIVQGVKLRTL